MDWGSIITELGGGLSAVVICALAFLCYKLFNRTSELQDKRVEDNREILIEAGKREAETIVALTSINQTMQAVLAQISAGGRD